MRKQIKTAAIALLVFIVLSNAGRAGVEVVGNKCVLVDGEPFFAIGIYSVDTPDFSMLAKAGFNLVHKYTWEGAATWDGGQKWLDAAHQNGLMALVGLYRPDVKQMSFEGAITRIEKL